MFKIKFLEALKSLLNLPQFQALIEQQLINLLKAQLLGGFRGWVVKTLVREFAEDVVEVLTDITDYTIMNKKAKDTINETDRNAATDSLNDIMQ